ncbi:MAG: polysaccharide biosynthesis C-terminal domain-containing protein [Thermoprotei archaeon]
MTDESSRELDYIVGSFSRGTAFLFLGRILYYFIGFVGIVIVARLLASVYGSAEPLGWLFVVSTIPNFVMLLGDFGIGMGISNKFLTFWRKGEYEKAASFFWTGFFYGWSLTITYSFIAFFIGGYILTYVIGKPDVLFLMPLVVLGMVCNGVYSIGWSGSIILDRTWLNGLMLVLQALIQYTLSIVLILLGYGVWGVALAYYVIAPLFSGFPSFLMTIKSINFKRPRWDLLKDAFHFGFPLFGGSLVGSVQGNVYNLLLSRFASSLELGFFSVAQRMSPFVDVLVYPLNTLLFPTFSRMSVKENLNLVFSKLVKLYALLVFISSSLIIILSKDLLRMFFGASYVSGYFYLELLAFSWLLMGFGSNVSVSLLIGQGNTKLVFRINLLGSLVALGLSFLFIPWLKVAGAILVSICSFWPSFVLSLSYIKRVFDIKYPFADVVKCLLISSLSVILAFLVSGLIPYDNLLRTVIVGLVSLSFYVFLMKRLNIISDSELLILEDSLKPIPFLGPVIGFLISLYKQL